MPNAPITLNLREFHAHHGLPATYWKDLEAKISDHCDRWQTMLDQTPDGPDHDIPRQMIRDHLQIAIDMRDYYREQFAQAETLGL